MFTDFFAVISLPFCGIPDDLAVKIPGFHPGGPGSAPVWELFECTNFAGALLSCYQALRLVKSARTFLMRCGSASEENTVVRLVK